MVHDIITGNGGNDIITGGAGDDSLTGSAGDDTFNVDSGTDSITDLGTGSDIFVVNSGATLNATDIVHFQQPQVRQVQELPILQLLLVVELLICHQRGE